jgi:hypothetical protein
MLDYISFPVASRWAKSTYEKSLVSGSIVSLGPTVGVSLANFPPAAKESIILFSQKIEKSDQNISLEWRDIKIHTSPTSLKIIQKELEDIPCLGKLINTLLLSPLSPEEFTLQSHPFAGKAKLVMPDTYLYSFYLSPTQYPLPPALGGEATQNETQRLIQIQVGYASWRDSRAKRLLAVRIAAQESWPERSDKPIKASSL